VDFWINNAGGDVLTGTLSDQTLEEKLKLLWQVDVNSTLMLSRRAGSKMREKSTEPGKNVILNMGWDQAAQGMAGDSGELFATTKGAIMAMTKSLAQSLSPEVRVNCIAPGWIKTEWGEQASDYWAQRATQDSLMERWGTPKDIAEVALFLCSPAASFVSGQIIPVNGGFKKHAN
jgi:3-oxoacyl-[acyl-carrier protein] reductase